MPRAPVPTQGVDENGAEVSWFLRPDGIGYVSIRVFRDSLETDLGQALASLRKAKGLIVDLRGNEGDELEKGAPFDPKTAFASFDRLDRLTAGALPGTGRPVNRRADDRCRGGVGGLVHRPQACPSLWCGHRRSIRRRAEMYRLTDDLYQVLITVKARVSVLGRPLERTGVDPDVAVRTVPRTWPRAGTPSRKPPPSGWRGRDGSESRLLTRSLTPTRDSSAKRSDWDPRPGFAFAAIRRPGWLPSSTESIA